MKNILSISAIALIFLASTTGCVKSSSRTTSPQFLTSTMSGGSGFTSTSSALKAEQNGLVAPAIFISIFGRSSIGDSLTFTISPFTGAPGTFPLSSSGPGVAVFAPSSGTTKTSAHGNIIFTSVTPDFVGTFNFTCTDSTVFSGSFDVTAPY